MDTQAALTKLKSFGTAQNRKVYGKHGVSGAMFGVSFANLKALAKQVKVDHALAADLWASGNHDARILATMVADPAAARSGELDVWSRDLDNYVVADAFSGFAAKTAFATKKADKWSKSKSEFVGQAGWNVIAHLAMSSSEGPDTYFADKIAVIEAGIHDAKNRTRHAMNMALCAIGIGRPSLRKDALAAAKRIGKVDVDHGDTSCKTPDAAAYIKKAVARKEQKGR